MRVSERAVRIAMEPPMGPVLVGIPFECMMEQVNDIDHGKANEMGRVQIVPVFLGSAENGSGVHRLLKALRHETPALSYAAQRVGADGSAAAVLKTRYAGQAGRQTMVRVMSGGTRGLIDGDNLTLPNGGTERAAGVFTIYGESQVLDKRESSKRPGAGIVTVSTTGRNQHGTVV